MIQIKVSAGPSRQLAVMEWEPINSAPFDRELELAVIDHDGPHAVVFACRRVVGGWINAESKQLIDVRPTHWRQWQDGKDAS